MKPPSKTMSALVAALLALTLAGCTENESISDKEPSPDVAPQEVGSESGETEEKSDEEVPAGTYSFEGVWSMEGAPYAFDSKYYYCKNYLPVPYVITPTDSSSEGQISFTYPDDLICADYTFDGEENAILSFPETGGTLEMIRESADPASFDAGITRIDVGTSFEDDSIFMSFDQPTWADEVGYDYDEPVYTVLASDKDGSTYFIVTGTLENYMSRTISEGADYSAYLLVNEEAYIEMGVDAKGSSIIEPMGSDSMFYYAAIADKKIDALQSATMYILFNESLEGFESYVYEIPLI